jgi:CIC family chloride channel protein
MLAKGKQSIDLTRIAIALPVGVVAALATLAFRLGIDGLNRLIFGDAGDITELMTIHPWFLWPMIVGAGGVVAGLFLAAAIAIEKRENIRTDYLDVIDARLDRVPTRTSLLRAISSLASIASGASIGREGPMVQLSALCGGWLGKFVFRIPASRIADVVAMAAAGGLAAVYHAPLAASIFVAEIAFGVTALQRIIPLITAAGVAVATMWLLGFRSALYPLASAQFALAPGSLVTTLALALLAGLCGLGLNVLISRSRTIFAKIGSLPLRLGLGGVLVGGLAIVSTDILGNGYEVILHVMTGSFVAQGLLALLLLKVLATSISVGSNAVGGLFTPSLLIGAALGALVATLCQLGGLDVGPVELYAAIGMGAVLASVSHAPLMAMLMVFEMTLNSSLLFPVMLSTVIASIISYHFKQTGTYPTVERHVSKSDAKYEFDQALISQMTIAGASVRPTDKVGDALAISSLKRERFVYVVSDSNRFLGAVSVHDIASRILNKDMTLDMEVGEVMDSAFPFVVQDKSLRDAWEVFSGVSLERLPVVDNEQDRHFMGALTKTSLIVKAKTFI